MGHKTGLWDVKDGVLGGLSATRKLNRARHAKPPVERLQARRYNL
jgi:hypothetical protein